MTKRVFAALALMMLAACSTSGPIRIACAEFDKAGATGAALRHRLPPSPLEAEIHGDDSAAMVAAAAEITAPPTPLQSLLNRKLTPDRRDERRLSVLLLSGGGQWGAFGATYLKTLADKGQLPDFDAVTGVSTGGLQSLFVALGTPEAMAAMERNYSPARESDVVDRHPQWQAAIRGSMAGLKPLRRKIEAALCPDGAEAGCPLIAALADLDKVVLIGFVEADSGDFFYVDAVEIARRYRRDPRTAQQCLAGAALASAAMPVFFQQVRVGEKSYYDGGVRQSVFAARISADVERAFHRSTGDAKHDAAREPAIYIVRNGPTTLARAKSRVPGDPLTKPDVNSDALTNAIRAEAIVVNQLEVGSIAALRLEHPVGPIHFVTADGHDAAAPEGGGCTKPEDIMFDPGFMGCLRAWGKRKAERTEPWRGLSPINGGPG